MIILLMLLIQVIILTKIIKYLLHNFYNKYIKAAYKNEDMINKMRANKEVFQNDDHHRSLILNKVSEYITDEHLKQFFS